MLYEKIDCVSYRKETSQKLTSFLQKSPCLFSFLADDEGIIIILVGEQKTFKFDWDYTIPIKSFIHKIKTTLYEYYPRLERSRIEIRPLSAERASEIKRVSPEIDTELEVVLERVKAAFSSLKAYESQCEELDDKLKNLFKQMNSTYDSGHLSNIM